MGEYPESANAHTLLKEILVNCLLEADQGNGQVLFVQGAGKERLENLLIEGDLEVPSHFHSYCFTLKKPALSAPYFPLLNLIQSCIDVFSLDIDELVDQSDVYHYHRDIIAAFLHGKMPERQVSLIFDEIKYEQSRMVQSVLNVLKRIATEHALFIEVHQMHYASAGLLDVMTQLEQVLQDTKIVMLMSFDQFEGIGQGGSSRAWERFVSEIEEKHTVLNAGVGSHAELDEEEEVAQASSLEEIKNAVDQLRVFLCLEDAKNYFETSFDKLELAQCDNQALAQLYQAGGMACYALQDYGSAIELLLHAKNYLEDDKACMAELCAQMSLVYIAQGKDYEADKQAKLGMQLARLTGDNGVIRKALFAFFTVSDVKTQAIPDEDYKQLESLLTEEVDETAFIWMCKNAYLYEDYYQSIDKVVACTQKAIDLSLKRDNQFGLAVSYHRMSVVQSLKGDKASTLNALLKSKDIRETLKDALEMTRIYNGIGFHYLQMEDFMTAAIYYKKAAATMMSVSDYNEVVTTLLNTSRLYLYSQNVARALKILDALLQLTKILNIQHIPYHTIDDIYVFKALLHVKLAQPIQAMVYLEKANVDNIDFQHNVFRQIVMMHLSLHVKVDKTLEQYHQTAVAFFEQSQVRIDDLFNMPTDALHETKLSVIFYLYEYGQCLMAAGQKSGSLEQLMLCKKLCQKVYFNHYIALCNESLQTQVFNGPKVSLSDLDLNISAVLDRARRDLTVHKLQNRLTNLELSVALQGQLYQTDSKAAIVQAVVCTVNLLFTDVHAWIYLKEQDTYRLMYETGDHQDYTSLVQQLDSPQVAQRLAKEVASSATEKRETIYLPFTASKRPVGYIVLEVGEGQFSFDLLEGLSVALLQIDSVIRKFNT